MIARRTERELKAMTSATAHVNVLWTVTPNLTPGAEFMHGRRTNTDDWFGAARRLQLMTARPRHQLRFQVAAVVPLPW